MKTHWMHILCAYITLLTVSGFGFTVQAVDPVLGAQWSPDVDNGIVVWAEQYGDYSSIFGKDLVNAPDGSIVVAFYEDADQDSPAIWNNQVLFLDNFFGDWDVYISDISDQSDATHHDLTLEEQYYLNDQTAPAIHGNTAVWQSFVVVDDGQGGTYEDWDIVAADITEPNNPQVFIVDDTILDQTAPAIHRSNIVYQDDYNSNTDIWSADVWLRNAPQIQSIIADDTQSQIAPTIWEDTVVYQQVEPGGDINIYMRDLSMPNAEAVLIAGGTGSQQNPDISGNIVVWQDNRHGNWDIYGYNLVTKQEFRITTDTNDQTQPAISGSLVVWVDERVDPANIYYTWLDDETAADCPNPVPGDINGDCQTNLEDYALFAQNWLICNLDPVSACTE